MSIKMETKKYNSNKKTMEKYHNDEEYRNKYKEKRKERYLKKRQEEYILKKGSLDGFKINIYKNNRSKPTIITIDTEI